MAAAAEGVSAEDVAVKLTLRALWPMVPRENEPEPVFPEAAAKAPVVRRVPKPKAPKPPKPAKPVTDGALVKVLEDFMSDSGTQDKVLLKAGQEGRVKRTIPSGHASIDFKAHKKLQWVAKGNHSKLQVIDEDSEDSEESESEESYEEIVEENHEDEYWTPPPSMMRRRMLDELNEVLDGGFDRRLAKLEKSFTLLQSGSGPPGGHQQHQQKPSLSKSQSPASVASSAKPVSSKFLAKAVRKALKSKNTISKRYGPSDIQSRVHEPEPHEEILAESATLHLTMESLEQNIAARKKQVASLKAQIDACEDTCKHTKERADNAEMYLRELEEDPENVVDVHQGRLLRLRRVHQALQDQIRAFENQARRIQILYREQQRYRLQHEHIAGILGNFDLLPRHAAGALALVDPPLPLDETPPQNFDIATAVANPYNVDSWPFEPNVLAKRYLQWEPGMESLNEEDEDEEEDEGTPSSLVFGSHSEGTTTMTTAGLVPPARPEVSEVFENPQGSLTSEPYHAAT
eukprot:CAMPEP_0206458444 /NCGR_PEP_ID=MMETSP0324_2-20121206/23574_1 /ASSEMBLY_ACC=CAM_ASM_000836 /TAXON_ID=2866 /ORGANISM="Crypthecodinium cohnii, Strain Seligo" /LENGTH=516 /DNA_ID=CAMNT_0053929785 /DNA_START=85 /DNA_END=1632 /DNA_ORIENTATION=-